MDHVKLHDKTFKPFIPYEKIISAIDKVADKINQDFHGCTDIPIVLCVLNGSIVFTGELLKRLNFPCQLVSMKLTSYEGTFSTGKVRQVMGLTSSVRDRRVIVVEEDMRRAFQGLVSEGDPSMNRLKTNVKLFEENFGYVEDWGLSRVREAFSNDTGDALLPYAGLVGGPLQPDMVGGQVYPYLGGGLLGEGQIKTSLCGSAVFAGDRMAGVLSGQHTMLVLMANGTFQTGHLRLPWKGTELDMALYVVGKPKRSWQAGTFTCEITLEADLEHPAQVEADSEELIAAAESYLEEELEQVFRATAAAGADVFSVGRDAICTFRSWDSWRAYGFARRLKEVEPDFRVKVKLSHSPKDPALE